ncbi:MAG: hypothetical protein JWR69_3364, partial [Pedosphaera sp.]|nr:hypothetical protein [Pedosphaera sp.]
MAQNSIERILEERRQAAPEQPEVEEAKCFSVLGVEGLNEEFLEFHLRDGEKTCFAYGDLIWFSHHPETGYLDLDFGGFTVSIKGRGLGDQLFRGIKQQRVAWIKESDSDMQDNPKNDAYIETILIAPPQAEG